MRLREYETIFIVRPDLGDDAVRKVVDRIKGAIESKGGVFLREENWGKRRLAYEVEKQMKGLYILLQYAGPAGVVEEAERTIKIIEQVIKYQTVKLFDDVNIETRREEIKKEDEERALRRQQPLDSPALPEKGKAVTEEDEDEEEEDAASEKDADKDLD